ncbi:MAG TPA: MFS transporter, partial [Planctomycetaceae bacterium]|nr:MFS transporter [Planctomycetaceae bacterium]
MASPQASSEFPAGLTATGRYLILAAAFLGWMFSGVQLTLMNLATGSATTEFVRAGTLDSQHDLSWARLSPAFERPPVSTRTDDEIKKTAKEETPRWFARYNSAFLLGAACGGLVFGWIGDRFGRVKAMALSIVWYSLFAGAAYVAGTPEQ